MLPIAHTLVARQDLPIPEWLFAWGASLVLIVSFIALAYGWRTPRLEDDSWRPRPGITLREMGRRLLEAGAGALGVILLGVSIWAGLRGTEAPDRNFSLTLIFVTTWVGLPILSALLGDVFRALNPWRAIGRVAGAAFRKTTGEEPVHVRYPERLGRWPAAIGLVAFVWLELIYGASGVAVGLSPYTVGVAALVYTAFTLAMMALFGVERWTVSGETFSVYFNMFSRLAPFEVRDGRLGVRWPLAATTSWASEPGSLALVVASIATTSFDGAQEGVLSGAISSSFDLLVDAGAGLINALRVAQTFYLLLMLAAVALVYLAGVRGMRTVRGAPPLRTLRRAFTHTLIPIALAYLVAHYYSLLVFQEQAQFTYLLSDPLGDGSNIFGTATGTVDYSVISATSIWYVQVAALVIGHVCALVLAHDRAIALWGNYRQATRSQYWMLAVMIAFTSFGLYLLSQSNR